MKLTFCGAAGTTTGSRHVLEINGQKVLLDCGLYQGRRDDTYERNLHFPFSPSGLKAVVLSHAHIDHSGNLPNLAKQGYGGNIYTTFATRDLCQLMLADSAKIQASDAEFVNRKRARVGKPPIEPLYTAEEAEKCLRQFVTLDYGRRLSVADGVEIEFLDAGHILGSAQVLLHLHEFSTGRKCRFLFSGDVGRGNNDILRDPVVPENIDFLLMESTYGNREHEQSGSADKVLCEVINRALERKGKILIPAFAVERTQQLVYALNRLRLQECFPPLPIYVDSPLAVGATEVFRLHPECFNADTYRFLQETRNPFGFDGLTMIREVSHSMQLNGMKEPCIIIAASGMCEAGRILHHLKNNIEDTATTVLFVGYCAEQTLGWKIRQGHKEVNIFGEPRAVNAQIEALDSFSGHADRSELLDYFGRMTGPRKRVWLVHGEPEQSGPLCEELRRRHPKGKVDVAELGQSDEF